jgi:hypothetical protein
LAHRRAGRVRRKAQVRRAAGCARRAGNHGWCRHLRGRRPQSAVMSDINRLGILAPHRCNRASPAAPNTQICARNSSCCHTPVIAQIGGSARGYPPPIATASPLACSGLASESCSGQSRRVPRPGHGRSAGPGESLRPKSGGWVQDAPAGPFSVLESFVLGAGRELRADADEQSAGSEPGDLVKATYRVRDRKLLAVELRQLRREEEDRKARTHR